MDIYNSVKVRTGSKATVFTEKDLEMYNYFNIPRRAGSPEVFGTEETVPGGLRYEKAEIIDVSRIDPRMDHVTKVQGSIRAERNSETDNIAHSIRNKGWDLREVSICVQRVYDDPEYDYIIREGCTRFFIASTMNITNLICEVYTHEDKQKDPSYFSFFMNTLGNPKGKATEHDLNAFVTDQLEEIGFNAETDRFVIKDEVEKILDKLQVPLTRATINRITGRMLENRGQHPYTSMRLAEAREFINRDCADSPFRSIAVGSDPHMFRELVKALRDDPTGSDVLRIVMNSAILDLDDPAKAWKEIVKGAKEMYNFCELIHTNFHRIDKVVGVVPQVFELKKKYPMKKVAWFDVKQRTRK